MADQWMAMGIATGVAICVALAIFILVLLIDRIFHSLHRQHGFIVQQFGFTSQQGVHPMAITGIVVGATGVFQETPTPAGATIPAGTVPQWSTSDTNNTTLTPSADGTQVSVAVSASAPVGGSFGLTVANQDGSFATTVTVPYLAPVPPAQTGFAINQIS